MAGLWQAAELASPELCVMMAAWMGMRYVALRF
jgi:hypothetical protein